MHKRCTVQGSTDGRRRADVGVSGCVSLWPLFCVPRGQDQEKMV